MPNWLLDMNIAVKPSLTFDIMDDVAEPTGTVLAACHRSVCTFRSFTGILPPRHLCIPARHEPQAIDKSEVIGFRKLTQ